MVINEADQANVTYSHLHEESKTSKFRVVGQWAVVKDNGGGESILLKFPMAVLKDITSY